MFRDRDVCEGSLLFLKPQPLPWNDSFEHVDLNGVGVSTNVGRRDRVDDIHSGSRQCMTGVYSIRSITMDRVCGVDPVGFLIRKLSADVFVGFDAVCVNHRASHIHKQDK